MNKRYTVILSIFVTVLSTLTLGFKSNADTERGWIEKCPGGYVAAGQCVALGGGPNSASKTPGNATDFNALQIKAESGLNEEICFDGKGKIWDCRSGRRLSLNESLSKAAALQNKRRALALKSTLVESFPAANDEEKQDIRSIIAVLNNGILARQANRNENELPLSEVRVIR